MGSLTLCFWKCILWGGGEGGEDNTPGMFFSSPVWPAQCSQAAGSAERPHNPLWSYSLSRDTASVRRMSWFFKYQFATCFQPGKTVGTKLLQVLPVWPKWGKLRPWCWRWPERTWRGRPPAWSSSEQPSTMRSGFSPWDLVFTQLLSPESLVSLFLLSALHLVLFLSDVSLSSPQKIYCRCDLSGTKTRSLLFTVLCFFLIGWAHLQYSRTGPPFSTFPVTGRPEE